MSRAENRLYQLIRERKTAANRSECITTGKISYSTGGIDFAHALSASRVQNAPLGTSLCGEPFIEVVIRKLHPLRSSHTI